MPRVMTTPTKQELRDTIKAQQETIDHLQDQLDDNESLRDKLASKAAIADNLERTLERYRDYEFKAECLGDLTAQLTLNDVATILGVFHGRFNAVLWDGKEAEWIEFADWPFNIDNGRLNFVFERNQKQSTDS